MKLLAELTPGEARCIVGVIFDLDDTFLDHGALSLAAYGALHRLHDAGLRLIVCTGRPAGWGEVVQRQWPIDAAVVENGALAFCSDGSPQQQCVLGQGDGGGRSRRAELWDLAHALLDRFPAVALADDNDGRRTDVTLDIGEHRRVPPADIHAMRAFAANRGARTLVSSIHLHLTFEAADKASGTLRLLAQQFGEDVTGARGRYAFVGDSANDAAAFAAFRLTLGVANVRACLRGLTVPPRYVASAPMGRGFAEIADRLILLRG